jgi:hypothetical protein
MKKTGLFGLVVLMLLAVTVTSCQKKAELSKMIPSDRVTINGKNGNLFEIEEDSVEVMLVQVGVDGDKWEVRTNLPLKNTTPWSKIPGSDSNLDNFIYGINIYAKYVDKNDSELDLSVQTDYQSGETLLKSNEIVTGNVPIIEYNFGNKSYEKQKAYFDHIDGAVLTVELSWAHKTNASSGSSSSLSSGSTSSSSQDWNKMLDDYEKYVNEYIKFVKKLSKGDKSVESQVDKNFWAADDLEDDLEEAYKSGKMTSAQKKRYDKIEEKFTDAVFEYDDK